MAIPTTCLRKSGTTILTCLVAGLMTASLAHAEPDNTAVNKRDQKETELTAQDQGGSARDIELTRKIRQQVVGEKALSTDAKNIKIISVNGAVTLKGPVKDLNEKNAIEKIAVATAGKSNVVNKIEVENK